MESEAAVVGQEQDVGEEAEDLGGGAVDRRHYQDPPGERQLTEKGHHVPRHHRVKRGRWLVKKDRLRAKQELRSDRQAFPLPPREPLLVLRRSRASHQRLPTLT